jgi:hypothetical protein
MTALGCIALWLACGVGSVLLAKRVRKEAGLQAPFPRADIPIALLAGPLFFLPFLAAFACDFLREQWLKR